MSQGWTKYELFLVDLERTRRHADDGDKELLTTPTWYDGKVYIPTNEDAPRYRVFVTDAGNYDREAWKEIIPQTDAVLHGGQSSGGKLLRAV